jgi:hypothetical protein
MLESVSVAELPAEQWSWVSPFRSSAISTAAASVYQALVSIQATRERSYALFGHKASVISSLQALRAEHSEPNWDGEGAKPVAEAALDTAVSFIRALPDDLPLPEIAAEPDGAISLDWAPSKHRVFTVSIGMTDRLPYAWLDGGDRGHGVARFDGEHVSQKLIEGIEGAMRGGHPRSAATVRRLDSAQRVGRSS